MDAWTTVLVLVVFFCGVARSLLVLEVGRLVNVVFEVIDETIYFQDALAITLVLLLVVDLLDHRAHPVLYLGDHVVLAVVYLEQVGVVRRLQRVHHCIFVDEELHAAQTKQKLD